MSMQFRTASFRTACDNPNPEIRTAHISGFGSDYGLVDIDGKPTRVKFRAHENGGVCCTAGPQHCCDKCKAHYARELKALSGRNREDGAREDGAASGDYAPVDPYAAHLATMRAASATEVVTPSFAERWAADRTREMEATRAALDASPSRLRTLSAEDLCAYAPPDPYRIKEAR
jgi:hypothetical protein